MTRTLKNYYFETKIDDMLQQEAIRLGLTKSKLVRLILKKHYNLCSYDECLNQIFAGAFCQIHSKNGFHKQEQK